jgi:hypothetical protein
MSKLINRIGDRYGRLVVISRAKNKISPQGQAKTYWNCLCDCGNTIVVSANDLRSGHTRSCGCYAAEVRGMSQKLYNKYKIEPDYMILYTTKNEKILIDKEDYEKIKDVCWTNAAGYCVGYRKGQWVTLHRLITDCPKNMEVDHINHNTLDNRKCNLRIVTRSQNNMNHGLRKDNTSGVVGVRLHSCGKWVARIFINGKEQHLGLFLTKEEAITARKEAEIALFGEYRFKGEANGI